MDALFICIQSLHCRLPHFCQHLCLHSVERFVELPAESVS
ncbi:hypothetical protein E6C60_0181 [Paenibacillus algicola]|uniref:Uncharacterized protein n=1 Tax=Paenibacillus algicola TaxID=2565926 RepID=A0A4P8XEW4_9BACL|nr:hypothetical protein E6C60_0181 [Paenibacillus algicola]